jgi:hypothetical protein
MEEANGSKGRGKYKRGEAAVDQDGFTLVERGGASTHRYHLH